MTSFCGPNERRERVARVAPPPSWGNKTLRPRGRRRRRKSRVFLRGVVSAPPFGGRVLVRGLGCSRGGDTLGGCATPPTLRSGADRLHVSPGKHRTPRGRCNQKGSNKGAPPGTAFCWRQRALARCSLTVVSEEPNSLSAVSREQLPLPGSTRPPLEPGLRRRSSAPPPWLAAGNDRAGQR